MPPKRRGSKSTIHTSSWTELFHRIAPSVIKDVIQGTLSSDTVIKEIPEIAKTAMQYVQKNIYEDNGKNSKEVKPNNIPYNKTKDIAITNAFSDENNYEHESESGCSISCKGYADDLNETDSDYLEGSFVHLDHESDIRSNILPNINLVITGLPDQITEDQVLKEFTRKWFTPLAVHKITSKEPCHANDSLFLLRVPEYTDFQLLEVNEVLGYKVEVQKQTPEHKISECTKCKKFGHDKTNCEILATTTEISEINKLGYNSTNDLGSTSVNSNNSPTSNTSICKIKMFSSSRHSTINSPSSADYNTSSDSMSKIADVRDPSKLMEQLKEIKKEVEQIKFELKINKAKKVDRDFLHVVLQGIPAEIKNEEIINDLKSKQFSVNAVYRLNNENNELTDEVVFELPKDEDHIFYFSCCLGFEVHVEEYKNDFSRFRNNSVVQSTSDNNISPKKPINVLFRGIPMDISESDILRDLREKRFHPIALHIMVKTKRYLLGKTKHVVLVQVQPEEEHIYELSCILGFPVTVEGVDKGTLNVAQCKKCLQFDHSAVLCSGKKIPEAENIPVEKCKITDDVSTLNAVVKGVPIEFSDDLVLNDIIKNGFNPIAVHRMIVDEEILPTYLIQVPEKEKRILMLTCCLGFSVKVENFIPSLYHVEQCERCRQFGHYGKDCTDKKLIDIPGNDIKSVVIEKNVESKESFNEGFIHTSICKKTQTDNSQTESTFTLSSSTRLKSDSAQPGRLEQESADQLKTLEIVLKEFIMKNKEEIHKLFHCNNVDKITTNDASTNTDHTYAQIEELTQAIKSYENISFQFAKKMELLTQACVGLDSSLSKAYLRLKELPGITTSFIGATIKILKSVTSFIIDNPNLPGVTINSINEQLHLLEQLEKIKINMDSTPCIFTQEYEVNFPSLD